MLQSPFILLTPSTTPAEYNPTTGRFLQRDPIGVNDALSLIDFSSTGTPLFPRPHMARNSRWKESNEYNYVRNHPLINFDPQGLSLITIISPSLIQKLFEFIPFPPGLHLNITEEDYFDRGKCGWIILRGLSDINVDLTWKATDWPLYVGCKIWEKSDDEIKKMLEDTGNELIQVANQGRGLKFDCHKDYRCCFKVKYNLKTPVTIYFNDFPIIPPKNFLAQCFLSGTISAKVDFKGEIGQCYKN